LDIGGYVIQAHVCKTGLAGSIGELLGCH